MPPPTSSTRSRKRTPKREHFGTEPAVADFGAIPRALNHVGVAAVNAATPAPREDA
jgi:hypothetical protein